MNVDSQLAGHVAYLTSPVPGLSLHYDIGRGHLTVGGYYPPVGDPGHGFAYYGETADMEGLARVLYATPGEEATAGTDYDSLDVERIWPSGEVRLTIWDTENEKSDPVHVLLPVEAVDRLRAELSELFTDQAAEAVRLANLFPTI